MKLIELEEGEEILHEVRKHSFAFWIQITGLIILAFVPPFLYGLVRAFLVETVPPEIHLLLVFGYLILMICLWISVFISWTNYFLDMWIVTNKRIIDFELRGLFSRDIASVNLENVQDVKIRISGLMETWLKIGEIKIQTAGTDREFFIKNAHLPEVAKSMIVQALDLRKKSTTTSQE